MRERNSGRSHAQVYEFANSNFCDHSPGKTRMSPEHTPVACIMHLSIWGSMVNSMPRALSQHSMQYMTPQRYSSMVPICVMPLNAKHSPLSHSQCRMLFGDAPKLNLLNTDSGKINSKALSMKSFKVSKDSMISSPTPRIFLTLLISIGAMDRIAALFRVLACSIPNA